MMGTESDLLGILSATISWNTVKLSRRVMPREIFSPESGGTQNVNVATRDRMMQGRMMFTT